MSFFIKFYLIILHLIHIKGARILCVFPVTSVSHQVVFQPIWKELSLRGHQVTVITPNPLKDPTLTNLREIDLSGIYEMVRKFNYQSALSSSLSLRSITTSLYYMYSIVVAAELQNPEVRELIDDKDREFDLVFVQYNFPTMHALSERFKCPLIGMSVSALLMIGFDTIGNSPHLGSNPDVKLPVRENPNFFDRIKSVLFTTWHRYHYHNTIVPREDPVARKFIKNDIPYLGDVSRTVSVLFLNANPFTYTVRPQSPALIDLENLYQKNNGRLPPDLQEELDGALEGFIYFSLGSNLLSTNISVSLREKVLGCFKELPYKVLWKWEGDHLEGKPENVIIRKWFPQTDILAHPNIKAFLMQGGIQSIDEAIAYNVPLIAMPIFLDQFSNTEKIVNLGIAKSISLFDTTKDEMKAAILEVIQNPRYRNRVKEIGSLVSDVPMRGLNKSIWWIEYVIRHQGAHFLKSAVVDLAWYQECLLDVIGCIGIVICVCLLLLYKICMVLIYKYFK